MPRRWVGTVGRGSLCAIYDPSLGELPGVLDEWTLDLEEDATVSLVPPDLQVLAPTSADNARIYNATAERIRRTSVETSFEVVSGLWRAGLDVYHDDTDLFARVVIGWIETAPLVWGPGISLVGDTNTIVTGIDMDPGEHEMRLDTDGATFSFTYDGTTYDGGDLGPFVGAYIGDALADYGDNQHFDAGSHLEDVVLNVHRLEACGDLDA